MMDVEERKRFYKTNAWQVTRQLVLERDNYECQMCKTSGIVMTKHHKPNKHKALDVHHIKDLSTHRHLAYEQDNLMTVCVKCHNKLENRFNPNQSKRKNWDDEKW